MATKATPMGAEPVGTTSASGSFSGKTRYIPIKSAEGTSIFYGDFVKLVTAGGVVTVAKDTGTTTLTPVVQTAGSTDLGRSKNALDASTAATTNTLPIRILGFVESGESTAGDAFTDLIVKFNAGMHAYDKPLGT